MRRLGDYGAFGGAPAFAQPLHTAQLNFPPLGAIEAAFEAAFERQYFTNHGPCVAELEQAYARYTGAKHAVCVANGTLALMVMARALNLTGEIIVPAFTFPATVQALLWAGLTPVLSDVDPDSHMITPALVEPLITDRTSAILGVHLWGRPCAPLELEALAADRGLRLMFDACHGIGCGHAGRLLGTFGDAEAFSFHATKLINAAEGGCVTTDDDVVAARLRTLGSFSPQQTFADIHPRLNAKMSEAQAIFALESLREVDFNIACNRERHAAFAFGLSGIAGIELIEYDQPQHNYQYVVLKMDPSIVRLSRDQLSTMLHGENVLCRNYFSEGMNRLPQLIGTRGGPAVDYRNTERLTKSLIQMPNGQSVSLEDVSLMCALIKDILADGEEIRARLS